MSFLSKLGFHHNSILSDYLNPKNIKQLLLAATLGIYLLYESWTMIRWKYKNSIVMKMARDVLERRRSGPSLIVLSMETR